jgi:catechol 2,3-dioxygenase-like lactoylglutathione lyase family enzyme
MAETKTDTQITHVGVVMVPVIDQDLAIEFYVEKLGLELRGDTPFGGTERWVEVAPAGGQTVLALVRPRQDAEDDQPGGAARVALNTTDIDATHAELRSRGVDVDDEIMRMGDPVPPMFWLRDQDGNSLLVVQGR